MSFKKGDKVNYRNMCQPCWYMTVVAVKHHEPDLFDRRDFYEYKDNYGKWWYGSSLISHAEWQKKSEAVR